MISARAWRSHGAKPPERRHNPLILRMFVLMTVEDQSEQELSTHPHPSLRDKSRNREFAYYETIAGGAGGGPRRAGASAVTTCGRDPAGRAGTRAVTVSCVRSSSSRRHASPC